MPRRIPRGITLEEIERLKEQVTSAFRSLIPDIQRDLCGNVPREDIRAMLLNNPGYRLTEEQANLLLAGKMPKVNVVERLEAAIARKKDSATAIQ